MLWRGNTLARQRHVDLLEHIAEDKLIEKKKNKKRDENEVIQQAVCPRDVEECLLACFQSFHSEITKTQVISYASATLRHYLKHSSTSKIYIIKKFLMRKYDARDQQTG